MLPPSFPFCEWSDNQLIWLDTADRYKLAGTTPLWLSRKLHPSYQPSLVSSLNALHLSILSSSPPPPLPPWEFGLEQHHHHFLPPAKPVFLSTTFPLKFNVWVWLRVFLRKFLIPRLFKLSAATEGDFPLAKPLDVNLGLTFSLEKNDFLQD